MKQKSFAVRSMLAWLLLTACVVLAVWSVAAGSTPAPRTAYDATGRRTDVRPLPAAAGTIPVNTADAEQLDHLPGIGPAMAERIIAEREENGPFFYPEDLMQVQGIGEKKLSDMRDMLDLTEE